MILALAGGVGGARMCAGLAQVLPPGELTIVVNTGDDFEHLGLSVSPDLDSVMYTMSGRNDAQRGWGLAGETWRCMETVQALGGESWFRLGDADLATHLLRTQWLGQGQSLTEVTQRLANAMEIRHRVIPMSDEAVRTRVSTDAGEMAFQDYFVRHQCKPAFRGVRWEGSPSPAPAFAAALTDHDVHAIVVCPSNPYLSIQPILALQGVGDAMRARRVPAVAVSPIVGGQAVKGPLSKMLEEQGLPVSSVSIARLYRGLLDGLVIDSADAAQAGEIEAMGMRVHVAPTLMTDAPRQAAVAREVLDFAQRLAQ